MPMAPYLILYKMFHIPPVPGLLDGASPIVVNKNMAIALGKALFWDMNVGSDGKPAAPAIFMPAPMNGLKTRSIRAKKAVNPSGQKFDIMRSGTGGGPNYTMTPATSR